MQLKESALQKVVHKKESQEQRDERLQQNITYIISIIYNIREQERHENET